MKFLKPPKHALDIKSHKAVVKKLNAILNAKVVDDSGNSIGTVHFADGNTVFVIKSQSIDPLTWLP